MVGAASPTACYPQAMEGCGQTDSGWRRLTPRVGPRLQLLGAAAVWMAGAAVLMARGVVCVVAADGQGHPGYGAALVALCGVAVGLVKARLVLVRYAAKAAQRIRTRGHACFFGLFAWSSWLFILGMMGGGVLLRHSGLVHLWWGCMVLGVVFVAAGTGLAIADLVFWREVLGARVPGRDGPSIP